MLRNLLLVAFLAASALAILPNHYHFKDKLNKAARMSTNNPNIAVTTGYMTQKLDHLSLNTSGATFTQRYYYTQQYALHQRVAFLYISVSGDFETSVITDVRNPVVKTAKQFGATVFSLEHRYYGQSKPNFDKFDSNNLQYLNSFQAIQDITSFIKYANTQFNMDPDVRWVLWGAGYGGIIAAEARKWSPDLVAGVIASSTPLTHEYDFWQFNDQVQIAIAQEGGRLCYQKIRQGFLDIGASMRTPEGRSNISDLFNLNPRLNDTALNYNDVQMFWLAIIAPFQEMIQFNNDFNIDIGALCTTIDNSTWTPMQVVYQAYVYFSYTVNNNTLLPLVTSYQQVITDLGNQSPNAPFIENRMWQYQMCTEFGWFYTTNNNEQGLFGAVVPASIFLNQCFDLFPGANLDATTIRDITIDYNNLYGSSYDYSGTNVVFTNGFYDPWSRLGKENTADFSVVAYVIPGGSWASDFFPGDSTNQFIISAHNLMAENINLWVNGPKNPKTSVNTTVPWTRPPLGEYATLEKNAVKEDIESLFSPLGDDVPSKKTFPEPPFKKVFLGRPPHGFLPEPDYDMSADMPPGFEEGTFRQRQDHFDNRNPDHFQQKFFKNAQWAKPGGPNFLMIGGEGPESARWVLNENITYLTWAKKYGATVYLLEHRFYGDSLVGDNTKFKLLTSLQMLYDLAEFIKATNLRTGTNNPWITFGGSYSGAMSAWMREVFPDLVIGAVASSGPVFAKTDFYEYLMVVERSIRTYDPTCADRIQSGFNTMRTMFLTKEGRQNLSTIFQLQPPFGDNVTDTDQHYFFSNIYSNFQGAVQYSGDNTGAYANGYGIPDMCKFMTNDTNTPLNNIVQFNQFMTIFYQGGGNYTGLDNKYQDMIDSLKNSQNNGPDSAAGLLWTWQTCNEFGYFQSADSGNGIFGSPTPVNMFVQMCMDIFPDQAPLFQRTGIDVNIAKTNHKYGERHHYRGTNVVMPNGNVDPWHALGLYHPNDNSVVPYLINGTAHCADMYPARDADVPGLKVVRDLIDQNIAIWLGQAPAGTTGTPGTAGTAGTGSTGATVQTTTQFASTSTLILSFIAVFVRYLL